MTDVRTVKRLHAAHRDDIGGLVTRRPLPGPGIDHLGAFLFLNHHGPQVYPPRSNGLPFGPHPHRGFETVTFILEGELAHRDSGGHESIIGPGGVQWMTAGSGLIHEEVSPEDFKRHGGPMEILQLWVNLPASLKMTTPGYTVVQADGLPTITANGASVNLIAGEFGGRTGPITSLTGVFMTIVEMATGGRVRFEGLNDRDVFLYVVRGAVTTGGTTAPKFNLVELSDGAAVEIEADETSVLLFGHAAPLREPVVAYGPFVMNSEDEIRKAFTDYRAGKFGTPT
jgi:redox-sensitive bicupin YhaK (pirin superfamily)